MRPGGMRRTGTRRNRHGNCSRTGKICARILPRRRLRQERSGWSRTRDNCPAFKRQRRAAIRFSGCVLGLGEDTPQQAKRGNGTPVSSLVQVVCINTCPACRFLCPPKRAYNEIFRKERRRGENSPLPSLGSDYSAIFCAKRMRIAATSALVALPCGARVVAVRPLIRPAPTAQRIASVAQLETLEASV